jgi:predicted metal-binding protein
VKHVRSDWDGAILVCGKCTKKVDGGFGAKGRTTLAKLLRKTLGLKKGRRGMRGVVETRCLGVCPRGAVVAIDTRRPKDWAIVPAGTDTAQVLAVLRLDGAGGDAVVPAPVPRDDPQP